MWSSCESWWCSGEGRFHGQRGDSERRREAEIRHLFSGRQQEAAGNGRLLKIHVRDTRRMAWWWCRAAKPGKVHGEEARSRRVRTTGRRANQIRRNRHRLPGGHRVRVQQGVAHVMAIHRVGRSPTLAARIRGRRAPRSIAQHHNAAAMNRPAVEPRHGRKKERESHEMMATATTTHTVQVIQIGRFRRHGRQSQTWVSSDLVLKRELDQIALQWIIIIYYCRVESRFSSVTDDLEAGKEKKRTSPKKRKGARRAMASSATPEPKVCPKLARTLDAPKSAASSRRGRGREGKEKCRVPYVFGDEGTRAASQY